MWKNADKRGREATTMLKNGFEFDDVTVLKNASKEEIIKAYN